MEQYQCFHGNVSMYGAVSVFPWQREHVWSSISVSMATSACMEQYQCFHGNVSMYGAESVFSWQRENVSMYGAESVFPWQRDHVWNSICVSMAT